MKLIRVVLVTMALAGCGKVADLRPAPGQSLPIKPAMASATPNAEQLLTPPPYAKPERIDELMKRSQPRQADRFDLPPPDGGAAPTVGEQEEPAEDETRISTPQ